MSILFKSTPKKNPRDLELPEKFYPLAVGNGSTDLKELAEQVASQCTVNRADCAAVLIALEDNIIRALRQGRIVRLGELGTFQVGVSGTGKETAEEVSSASIESAHINFRPGMELSKMLKTLTYKKTQEKAA
jgi:predicted histone-like DNA-binding protein